MNFGVVRRQTTNSPAYGSIFLGLVKERQARVRPTLLEQTDIKSLRFDFRRGKEELTLARRPLLGLDAVPLVDLRELGSPLAQYACRVERLVVNRRQVDLQRPCYAVVDTGTTGLVISDSLYDSDELPLPGAAIREVVVEVLTERGRTSTFAASRRVQRERGDELPLICTEERIPWFDAKARAVRQTNSSTASSTDEPTGLVAEGLVSDRGVNTERDLAQKPHVLFLGLAFLDGNQLTIDVDDRRLSLVNTPTVQNQKAGSAPPDAGDAPSKAPSKAGTWGWGVAQAKGVRPTV